MGDIVGEIKRSVPTTTITSTTSIITNCDVPNKTINFIRVH